MTAWPEQRRGGLVAALAARAEGWLLEPAVPRPARAERQAPPRPVVAVIGLARRCGTTTLARALAAELAARDPVGAAVVATAASASPSALATAGARRLARALGGRAVGRLALVAEGDPACRALAFERTAPFVLDVSHGSPPEAALAVADLTVLVAAPDVEPALAEVAAGALARRGPDALVVLNRAPDGEAWSGNAAAVVAESRLGARLALAGREAVGPLAVAVVALADACAEAVVDG